MPVGTRVTRCKIAAETHSSGASSASSGHWSNRKNPSNLCGSAMDPISGLRSAVKPMAPPLSSSMAPPRTASKTKPSASTKEITTRPMKKLAKEQSDSATPLSGISSRGMIATSVRATASFSRGNSSSPHSNSPVQCIISLTKTPSKKPDAFVPGKSRILPPGSSRRLREPTRSPRASHATNITTENSVASRVPPLTMCIRSKCGTSVSKSGVEDVIEMDEEPNVEAASSSGTELPTPSASDTAIYIPTVNCHPPVSEKESRSHLRILELENHLELLSTELDVAVQAKDVFRMEIAQMTEGYNAALQQLQTLTTESNNVRAKQENTAVSNRGLIEEVSLLRTQVETLKAECDHYSTEHRDLHELNEVLLTERETRQQEILTLTTDNVALRQQTNELRSVIIRVTEERDLANSKSRQTEERLAKLQEDQETAKKDMSLLRKKRETDRDKAVEQVMDMQKMLQTKESEAQSWQAMTELKCEELRKVQKELEDARVTLEMHAICEAEMARLNIKIISLENKISTCMATEKDLRSEVRAKETVLRDLRRQSSLLTQEKETLKYRLDELSEPADERRRESRRSMTFPKESLRMQLDSVSEQENI